jgi:hypothetical protein
MAARPTVEVDNAPGGGRVAGQRRVPFSIGTREQTQTAGPSPEIGPTFSDPNPDGGLLA